MTPYLIAYTFYFIVLGAGVAAGNLRKWSLIASIPILGLVFLRGMVGVDMPMYEQSVDLIRSTGTYTSTFEPLFEYIVLFIAEQIDNSSVVLLVLAAFTTSLLYFGSFQLEREPYVFLCLIVPYFFFDMTMNGVRYGLAFSIVVFGAQFLITGRKKVYIALTIAASFIQISSGLLALLLFILLTKRWQIIFFSFICAAILFLFFDDYLLAKFNANSTLEVESAGAGFAPLLLSFSTLLLFWQERDFKQKAKVQFLALAGIAAFTFLITQFYYAGLRFQLLNLFLIYIFIAGMICHNKLNIQNRTIAIVFLIGLLGAGSRLKNFQSEEGSGDAPFAPYHFFWER